ncbi:crossover junction endodeoxyribonuclease RuvC [Patescibacteria group bacterium]
MIILGIDPGTASMGYGVIKIHENRPVLKSTSVIKTSPEMDMHKRLGVLYSNLDDIAKTFKPELVVIESLFFNTNTKTAITVGQARGISMLVAAHNNASVVEYTALQAKKILTGYGRSDKKEMQQAVKKILGLSNHIKSDDANDGVAMALCHFMLSEEKKK